MKVGGCVSLPVLQPAISEALERALQTQSASLRIYVKETVTLLVNAILPSENPGPFSVKYYKKEGVSDLLMTYQIDTPNSYRLMKRPITRSCMVVVLEKQIVRRTNRLIRVRKLMCLLSI